MKRIGSRVVFNKRTSHAHGLYLANDFIKKKLNKQLKKMFSYRKVYGH